MKFTGPRPGEFHKKKSIAFSGKLPTAASREMPKPIARLRNFSDPQEQ